MIQSRNGYCLKVMQLKSQELVPSAVVASTLLIVMTLILDHSSLKQIGTQHLHTTLCNWIFALMKA